MIPVTAPIPLVTLICMMFKWSLFSLLYFCLASKPKTEKGNYDKNIRKGGKLQEAIIPTRDSPCKNTLPNSTYHPQL